MSENPYLGAVYPVEMIKVNVPSTYDMGPDLVRAWNEGYNAAIEDAYDFIMETEAPEDVLLHFKALKKEVAE
jgi:hypothetical protein